MKVLKKIKKTGIVKSNLKLFVKRELFVLFIVITAAGVIAGLSSVIPPMPREFKDASYLYEKDAGDLFIKYNMKTYSFPAFRNVMVMRSKIYNFGALILIFCYTAYWLFRFWAWITRIKKRLNIE